MIAVLRRIAVQSGFRRLRDVVHLTRADVVEFPVHAVVVAGLELGEGTVHRRPEQDLGIRLLGTVGVDLHERPLRPALDMHAGADPIRDAIGRRRAAGAHVGVLDPRDQAELAIAPLEAERALDDHQVAAGRAADLHRHAGVVRLALARLAGGVVDAVDGARLAGVWRGRQREIGVAAFLAQYRKLVVHAASTARRVRVVERPVAVDERPDGLAGLRVARQRVVAFGQDAREAAQVLAQAVRRVVVVVKVDLDLAEPLAAQFDQRVEMFDAVLLGRKEEAVNRRPAIGVPMSRAQLRIPLPPARHPRALDLVGGRLPARLEVVDEAEQQVARDACRRRLAPASAQETRQPSINVLGANLADQEDACRQRKAAQKQEREEGDGHCVVPRDKVSGARFIARR